MDHNWIVKRFVGDLEQVDSLDAAVDVLHDAIMALGWPQAVYGWVAQDGSTSAIAAPPLLVRNFPTRWDQKWCVHGVHDPYFHTSRRSSAAVDWSDVQQLADLSQPQRDCMAYAADWGLIKGLTIPINVTGRSFAFVTAVGDPHRRTWSEQVAEAGATLMLIANYFDNAVIRLFERRRTECEAISQRELQCLGWSARGKTVEDIATILDLSADTVRVYMKRINRKLNAVNRTHAVAKALYLGLIDLN